MNDPLAQIPSTAAPTPPTEAAPAASRPVTRVRLRLNGPIVLENPVEIIDSAGNVVPTNPDKPVVSLCRCGLSTRKPFCDGTHSRNCWLETDPVPAAPAPA